MCDGATRSTRIYTLWATCQIRCDRAAYFITMLQSGTYIAWFEREPPQQKARRWVVGMALQLFGIVTRWASSERCGLLPGPQQPERDEHEQPAASCRRIIMPTRTPFLCVAPPSTHCHHTWPLTWSPRPRRSSTGWLCRARDQRAIAASAAHERGGGTRRSASSCRLDRRGEGN